MRGALRVFVAFVLVAAAAVVASACSRGGAKYVSVKQSRIDTPVWTWKSGGVSPPGRAYASMAVDPISGRLVLFGGYSGGKTFNETWTSDGTIWTRICPTSSGPCNASPSARQGAYMAPDSGGKLVLFGGCKDSCGTSSDFFTDTWLWDGATSTWQQTGITGPSGMAFGAMAYDPSASRTVLYGGRTFNGGTTYGVWHWNGSTWTDVCPSGCTPAPPTWSHHAMAYDQANQRLVAYGSDSGGTAATALLKWNGTTYGFSEPVGATQPGVRYGHAMASDAVGTAPFLLFGGNNGVGQPLNDVWSWSGSGWVSLSLATPAPAPRLGASMGFIGGSYGGFYVWGGALESDGSGYGDLWYVGPGQVWEQRSMGPRFGHGAAYDPGTQTTFIFGGFDGASRADLWSWNGTSWGRRIPPSAPTPTSLVGVAVQESQSKLLAVGGGDPISGVPGTAESWVYDIATNSWTRECQGAGCVFPGLLAPAMAYDSDRDCLVLQGGFASTGAVTDRIFERCGSDGYTWKEVCTSGPCQAGKPTARAYHAAAYDRNRHRTVFFGGCYGACNQGYETLGDVYEWDGAQWHTGSNGPPALRDPSMSYDTRRKKVVLLGGRTSSGGIDPVVYEYNGAWTAYSDASGVATRAGARMAYDRQRGVTVLHGGTNQSMVLFGDTWEGYSWGGACSTNADCDDGFPCVTGFCCSSACSGQCQVCAMALGSPQDGVCGDANFGFPGKPPCSGGYVCGGSGQPCLTSCAGDANCQDGYFCDSNSTCQLAKAAGAACPDSACKFAPCRQCNALPCVDGVCCQTPCNGLCERCTLGTGVCAAVPDGQEDAAECTDGTVNLQCGVSVCNGARACRYANTNTSCGSQTCASGTLTLASTCDGFGGCSPAPTQGCGGFACDTGDPTKCRATCTPGTGTGCIAGFTCNTSGNACVGGKNPGETCNADGECHSGVCADHKCCSGPCDHTAPTCGGSCDSVGACTYPGAATACTCGGSTVGQCGGAGVCDCAQHDGGQFDGGQFDGPKTDGPQQDAAGSDAPVGDGAAADAVGPQEDGPGPQQDAGGKTGTTSFLGCSAAPATGASALPLLLLAVAATRLRRRP